MRRIVVTSLLGLFFQAGWQGLALIIPSYLNVFLLPPLILVFSLQFFKPLETIILCIICGAMIDAIGGYLIGVNMVVLLVVAFFLGASNVFSRRASGFDNWIYVGACSLIYRVSLFLAQWAILGNQTNNYIAHLFIGPVVDALFSSVFFFVLVKVLHLVKAFEQNEFFKVKMGSRL